MDGYPADWDTRRRRIYRRDNYQCQDCGRQGGPHGDVELHCHHIVPKSQGGSHDESNLVTVCASCHAQIHVTGFTPSDPRSSPKLRAHAVLFVLMGWWTLGIANLVYELLRQEGQPVEGDDGLLRMGKREGKKGFWQSRVDSSRNQQYGGCPSCNHDDLTVSWIKRDDGKKAKVIECTHCGTMFDETESVLTKVESASELDASRSAIMQELFG